MNTPTLFLVGATHRTAPFGFREKLALSAEAEAGFASELGGLRSLREFVILNTCNRVEIYGLAADDLTADQVAGAFCARQHVDAAEFSRLGFSIQGLDAVQHLLEVASGLDSQMLGETEIFGQTKRALATAQTRGSAGPVLNRLFQKAFQAAKQVRTDTAVTIGQVSVANVAVDVAMDIFGRLSAARVLVLGAGEMGEKSGKAFVSRGAPHLTVASRKRERAQHLAATLHSEVLEFEDRESRLADWDVVVCSTSAPGTVLSAAAVREAMKARSGRPLLLVDLAMPRDIEAAAGQIANVFLYNLDDLALIAEKNRRARLAEAERARAVLAPRIELLWHQVQNQMVERAVPGARRGQGEQFPSAIFA